MDLDLTGRRALVTGGSLGIGYATAGELAANGVDVAINARDAARLENAANELSSNSAGRVLAVPGDMSKADDVDRVVREARDALGGIDILINNAGSSPAGRIDDFDDDAWFAAFELKFMGYVRCARAVLGGMRANRWGRIINIIGKGGHNPAPGYVLGGPFNAALLNFTVALAKDCAPDNVLVNGINPGATDTPRWQTLVQQNARSSGRSEEEIMAQSVGGIPLGRLGRPEDIANLAAFLCSDRAGQISGAVLNVDGASTEGF